MNPHLTICIPTYNRTNELSILFNKSIKPIRRNYSEAEIEIIVGDNSDADIAHINESTTRGICTYIKNADNIGYAGNVLNLVSVSSGKFIWIISDNDELAHEGIDELIAFALRDQSDALLIKYTVKGIISSYNGFSSNTRSINIREFVKQNNTPFILLSAVVFRRGNKDDVFNVAKEFSNNHFIQIPLILSQLNDSAIVENASIVSVLYTQEKNGRFDIVELHQSLRVVFDYLEQRYQLDMSSSRERALSGFAIIKLNADLGIHKIVERSSLATHLASLESKSLSLKTRVVIRALRWRKIFRILFILLWHCGAWCKSKYKKNFK